MARVYKTRVKESTLRLGLRVDPEQAIVPAQKSSAKAQSMGQQELEGIEGIIEGGM